MKLTKEDKSFLERLGHPQEDFKQLEDACNEVSLKVYDNLNKKKKPRRISRKRAIELLGRETFLNGISRAAFHRTAERTTSDGNYSIGFDLSKWW